MLAAILAVAVASPAPFVFRDRVEIKGDDITLGAVADLTALPIELRSRAEALSLLKMRPKSRGLAISHEQLASRARALMPALVAWLPSPKGGAITINAEAQKRRYASAPCNEGVAKGTIVTIVVDARWFRVERQVEAIQDGKSGGLFFARTPDGEVMQLYCEGDK